MALADRDKRALLYLGAALLGFGAYFFWPAGGVSTAAITAGKETVELAEQRLARLRQIAASIPDKEDILKKVNAELATREAGLLRAETGAQAQAQLFTILRRLGSEEAPAIEVRQTELGSIDEIAGGAYGLARMTVQFECGIAQLINLLASLAAQPELIVTQNLQIDAANAKQKTVRVRLAVAAAVPKELLPQKASKGAK